MAYTATLNGEVFFSTDSISQVFALASAQLELKAGAAGLFSFTVLPNNKFYDEFELLSSYIDVYRNQDLIFSGRVTSITQNFDLSHSIEAQGLLSILNHTIFRPILHEGTLHQLVSELLSSHNAQVESAKQILVGDIQISDAACYRAYENYETTYSRFSDLVDSFGGYLYIRKTSGKLYLDWKRITVKGAQSVNFGENLLDITKGSESENYITVLIPLGAQIEDEATGVRSRVTIKSVNDGKDYISIAGASTKIVGTCIWDDVTEPSILLSKGEAWLQAQSILKTRIDVSTVDLADAGYNIDHFEIGTVIEATSRPHGLDGQTFECLAQSLNLLSPDDNKLTLGGVVEGFTIKAQKEAKLNTRIIEKIDANYSTNKRLNDIKATLDRQVQENYTLIEQNSENIVLLSEQVRTASKIFYEEPVPPYSEGDLWYRGNTSTDTHSAVPGYAIPGYSVPGVGGDLYICMNSKEEGETFAVSDWKATYKGQLSSINTRITSAKIDIDAAKGQIELVAKDVNNLTGRVRSAEININAASASINAVATNVDTLAGRVSTAELNIDAANQQIALKVSNSDYNAATIVAKINGAGSSVTINASHINLEGVVTANEYFKILANGKMVAVEGEFTGKITANTGSIGGFTIENNTLHTTGIAITDYATGSVGLAGSTTFSRVLALAGTSAVQNLKFAIGKNFGVNSSGDLYAGVIYAKEIGVTGYVGQECTVNAWNIRRAQLGAGSFYGHTISSSDSRSTSVYVQCDSTGKVGYSHSSNNGSTWSDWVSLHANNGYIYSQGSTTASDRRKKHDVEYLSRDEASSFIYGLKPCKYRYNDVPEELRHGFIAQDVEEILTHEWAILNHIDETDSKGRVVDTFKTLNYTEIIADLVSTVQSLNERVRILEGGMYAD